MENQQKRKNGILIALIVLVVCIIGFGVYYFINRDNYYKQLQKTHDIAIKIAKHTIDSLEQEKLTIRKEIVELTIKNDSLQLQILKLQNKSTQIKKNYEKVYRDIDSWSNDDIDSFFANRNKSDKNR